MNLTDEALAYHDQLMGNIEAQQYMEKRGLKLRTVTHFQLGWIEEPLSEQAEKFVGKPVIPYMTALGKCIWLRARTGGKAKYLPVRRDFPLPQPRLHLFNAQQAMPTSRSKLVYIVEGEYDACIAWQSGVKAVGVPGARNFRDHWVHLFASSTVVVALDGDDVGQEAAAKVVGKLKKARVDVDTVELPPGKDLTDIWQEGGREAVRSALTVA